MMSNIHLATHLLSKTKLYSQWKNIGPLPASSRKTLNILPKGGICQDLRKHEGAVPARVNEAFALIDGGDHSASWTAGLCRSAGPVVPLSHSSPWQIRIRRSEWHALHEWTDLFFNFFHAYILSCRVIFNAPGEEEYPPPGRKNTSEPLVSIYDNK